MLGLHFQFQNGGEDLDIRFKRQKFVFRIHVTEL